MNDRGNCVTRQTMQSGRQATSVVGLCVALCCVGLLVAALPAAAQTEDREADPTAPYFARDHVLEVAVEMAPEDWERLRTRTRTLADIVGGADCLAEPVADIFSWFSATVTVDGVVYREAGVRKKGFFGSLSSDKPSLKVRFDKYVDDQLLGGVIDRITLNNSKQDVSMINTCLAYEVFAAAGLPAPRCNFATVTVNGTGFGLYVHVEEIKPPFLARHFARADGNLYEGTLSDFRPDWRGTFEKKSNEDAGDWSDVEAVIAALQDASPAGLEALDAIVDRDRFLSFWATEVLVGHWDGYAGNRNNYHFYREPGGRFVFIPWGVDTVFATNDVPFDAFESPPSVNAHGALAHRLYRDPTWRAAYADRLRHLLDTVWQEDKLLRSANELATVVRTHAPPAARAAAAADADRVRRFIRTRRGEILADLKPAPPDWPWPLVDAADVCLPEEQEVSFSTFELEFATVWGTKDSPNPFETGAVARLEVDGSAVPVDPTGGTGASAGVASAGEAAEVGLKKAAFISMMTLQPDFSLTGFTVWLPPELVADGAALVIGEDGVGGVFWTMPAGAAAPESFFPVIAGTLQLTAAGTEPGAVVSGRFSGAVDFPAPPSVPEAAGAEAAPAATGAAATGLVINEIAAQGDPLDWVELYNASDSYVALANFVLADDLTDAGKRAPFPPDLVIAPGAYLGIELDKDGWPGFALGKDEELGIWTVDGALVGEVDWNAGQADAGTSFARIPDITGDFRTTRAPTPGAANRLQSRSDDPM